MTLEWYVRSLYSPLLLIFMKGDTLNLADLLTAVGVSLDDLSELSSDSLRYDGINILVYLE